MKATDNYYGFACILGRTPGIPEFKREYADVFKGVLTPTGKQRKWRVDFAFPSHKLALEIEGVTYEGGRHQRIGGFRGDMEKYNALTMAGWSLLRVTSGDVRSGKALRIVMAWFNATDDRTATR